MTLGTVAPPATPSGGKPAFAEARESPDSFAASNIWSEAMCGFSTNHSIPYGAEWRGLRIGRARSAVTPLVAVPAGGRWEMTIKGDGDARCLDGP